MLSLINRAVAGDDDGEHTILVFGSDGTEDKRLVDGAAHGHDVGTGSEDEVVDMGDAQRGGRGAGEEIVEGEVTHGDSHDTGVGDGDVADHVGAVGVGFEFDGEGGDVEAGELVEACEETVRAGTNGARSHACSGLRMGMVLF